MNTPDTLSPFQQLTCTPLPASQKTYLKGEHHPDIRVPTRDIILTNGERINVYDTAGPYTDPNVAIDVRKGLPAVRNAWLNNNADLETYSGRSAQPLDDGLKNTNNTAQWDTLIEQTAGLRREPRRAKSGNAITQMALAKRGIITPEMEYVALRENGKREWMGNTP